MPRLRPLLPVCEDALRCGSGVRHLRGAERVPQQEPSDDLEDAHDDEPYPQQHGQDVERGSGAAATTIPAMRLTTPKMIHQALPSRTLPELPPISAASPWTIQVMPINRPTSALVR